MKNYFKTSAFVIILAFTFFSCKKKDSQPSTPLKSEIAVKIKSGNLVSPIASGTKGTASISWSNYNVILGDVSFSGTKDGVPASPFTIPSKEFEFKDGSKADLLGTLLIPEGSYSKSQYTLNFKARTGNALEISGVYTDVNGIAYTIKFVCKQEVASIAVGEDKIIKPTQNYLVDIIMDWDKLSANITTSDLANVTYISKNSILIDETNNPDLYAKFKNNLSTIAHFTYNQSKDF
ncbi:hypothetical protein [Pedobacter boryungensis]|uniref:Uncharacterized protein n=1 Tax=Pedobacter boryungensis TaxID=869962 RepID=A0ABX2DIN3_9SPHI|nr:hypothetical protein [Pedobacter boryungensis]NQX33156.1 hypothetical protein [Pedobacter boryungensis]